MAGRSPKQPGEYALARARREWRASTVLVGLAVLTIPVAVLAFRFERPLVALLPLVALGLVAGRLADRRGDAAVRWTKGALSEAAVGTMLEALRGEGYVVVHDREQLGEGNIDHVVAGPTGVFLIETKHRWYVDSATTKAKRQAVKLHNELGVWITPVICVHARRRSPIRHDGVWVMSAEHLLDWIRAQHDRPARAAGLARLSAGR
ncbi:MAG TPA: nuclease-related domain-containing protein [Gaiellaceae bacterium]|nr:nuclease-related domain-containing protein [Gaiellaceae bacterium]